MAQEDLTNIIFLDPAKTEASAVNHFLNCRDGIVNLYEYKDESGYGARTRLFLCEDAKHESISIIRQVWSEPLKKWLETTLDFDADSFRFLRSLMLYTKDAEGGKHTLLKTYL